MTEKKRERWGVPRGIADIVISLCADYDRRKTCVTRSIVPPSVQKAYEGINSIIDQALENVEPGMRQDLLTDIQMHRGYMYSPASVYISKNAYYSRKRMVIYTIAKFFNLV